MKVIEVTEKEVKAAFDAAKSDEMKNVLAALFCKPEDRVKPSLDDYKSIKTYEDACEALGEEPVEGSLGDHVDKHIIALIKLETISRALWGKDWQPKPDPDGSKYFYYPWFALYTQSKMDSMSEEDRGALLGAGATSGAGAGFGCLGATYRSSRSLALGFRLCQETEEKAKYFGVQFKEIWADYLAFNFTVENK